MLDDNGVGFYLQEHQPMFYRVWELVKKRSNPAATLIARILKALGAALKVAYVAAEMRKKLPENPDPGTPADWFDKAWEDLKDALR